MISSQAILRADNLCVGYAGKKVLSDLCFNVEKGNFVAFLGPNGAGKTTLLRTLSRHLQPLGGVVYIDSTDMAGLSQNDLARRMSVVLTEKVNLPFFKVWNFVALGRYPHTNFLGRLSPHDEEAVSHALDLVHAANLSSRDINTLSDGERQKVLIARALAQDPRIILLDEPTMHLDLKHRMEVMTILRDLCREQGITVVASLHDVDIAAKVSDTVALVKDGCIRGWGDPETVLNASAVSDLYDFSGVSFDRYLGSIEVRGQKTGNPVFVVGGMGSAAVTYRLLAKRGFSISTGVLHRNDLDYYVAQSLGAQCFSECPMEAVSTEVSGQAEASLESAMGVIDTGFTVGALNHENHSLVMKALSMDKPVFSLREKDDARKFYPEGSRDIHFCINETGLLNELEGFIARERQ